MERNYVRNYRLPAEHQKIQFYDDKGLKIVNSFYTPFSAISVRVKFVTLLTQRANVWITMFQRGISRAISQRKK